MVLEKVRSFDGRLHPGTEPGVTFVVSPFLFLSPAVLSDYDSADPEENGSHSEVPPSPL